MGTNCSLKNSGIRPFIFYLRAFLLLIESQVWEKKKETILKHVQGMALSLILDGPAMKKLASLTSLTFFNRSHVFDDVIIKEKDKNGMG